MKIINLVKLSLLVPLKILKWKEREKKVPIRINGASQIILPSLFLYCISVVW